MSPEMHLQGAWSHLMAAALPCTLAASLRQRGVGSLAILASPTGIQKLKPRWVCSEAAATIME